MKDEDSEETSTDVNSTTGEEAPEEGRAEEEAGTDTEDKTADENAASSDSQTLGKEEEAYTEKTVKVIAIDAGHQLKGNSEKEPNGPGSTVMKAKVTSGATGVSSKVPEYVLTLEVSKKLKEVLLERGYEVVMIRETHEVNLSNSERAKIANEKADLFIRIHANGADDPNVSGALTIYPSKDNEYVAYMSEACKKLSEAVVNGLCEATGAKNRGAVAMDNMSGINWCTIPVTIVEMGYLSSPAEDELMQQDAYQDKIAKGIADGIDAYVSGQ
ncbi:MAG: N-acetylmuramoyl-L-alanine amidase [Lachnospiraceae bacterium]|nr:N-acetylmuramoyl-L-alanine amidase [Lachnospiraceae bacterium]